jgi:DNA-binding HxlR family transcriptional regulator
LDFAVAADRATMNAMAEYGRFCPVALASEVLADRWTPLIIRELVLGNTRFNAIARGLPGISRSLLVQRLRHLERCGVIETWPSPSGRGSEYHLTPAGKDLEGVVMALGRWAIEWLFDEIRLDAIDAFTLMWWMHRRVDEERLPDHRVVVEFRHTEPKPVVIWLLLDRGDASMCVQHPGFEPDVVVTAPTPVLAGVFAGYDTWAGALASGALTADGPPRLTKALPRWFLGSPFVPDTQQRLHRPAR